MSATLLYNAVIVANGDYPATPQPLQILEQAPYVACCDGAANEYLRHGNIPNVIIGDGDSLTETNRQQYQYLLHRITEQETNDLTKTVTYVANIVGKQRIAIVGATGKREDHTIGNISLLIEYLRRGWQVCMYTDYGMFIPCRDTVSYPCKIGQQLSIINFTASQLQGEGLRYPLYDFNNWWQGTLNECTETLVTIHAKGEYLLYFVYP